MYTAIKVPDHWTTADRDDIIRELIGQVIECEQLPIESEIMVLGVRNLKYHSPKHPGWATIEHSQCIRQAGYFIEVKWRKP